MKARELTPRGGALVLSASTAVIIFALLGLASPTSVAEDSASAANAFLSHLAHTEGESYRARQLVVYFGHPQSAAVLDVQSTRGGEFVRAESGSAVTKLWRRPGIGIVSASGTSLEQTDQSPVPIDPKDVLAKYDIEVGRPQEHLGVSVAPVTLRRRDDGKLVERWLVHAKSGFVYERGLYDASEKLVAMSTIIEMHWGDPGLTERFDPGASAPTRVRQTNAPDAPKRLAKGYRLLEAYRLRVAGRPAQHWVYTDGLHALSVFRTNGGMRAPSGFEKTSLGRAHAWTGPGPGTWAWQGGGHSYVLVAEEPALEGAEMIQPFPKGGPSVWARMGSVWARMFHAVGRVLS